MVIVNFNFKFVQFLIFCFLVFLYCVIFLDLKSESSCDSDKYYVLASKYENKMDDLLTRAQKLESRYTSDEFIDKFLKLEENWIKTQEVFNNKIIFQLNLPIKDSEFGVTIHNRDWMLLACTVSQWCIDFMFFKMHSNAWRNLFQDLCLQQPIVLNDLLEKFDQAIELKNDLKISQSSEEINKFISKAFKDAWVKYFCAMSAFAVSANIIYRVKKYYRLDSALQQNLMDFAFLNVLWKMDKNLDDTSLTAFLNDKTFIGLPLDLIQTTGLDVLTTLLCNYGLIPYWVKDKKFDLFRRFAFSGIFIWWMQKKICKPIVFNYLTTNRKILGNILNKFNNTDLDQRKLATQELSDFLSNIPESSFSLMEMGMRKKFAQWQTFLNVMTLIPAAYTVGFWCLNLNKGKQ